MNTDKIAPKVGDRVQALVNRRAMPVGSQGVVIGVEMGRVYRVEFEGGVQQLYSAWQIEVVSR